MSSSARRPRLTSAARRSSSPASQPRSRPISGTILHDLRSEARYRGPIVVLTYYSLSYSDPAQIQSTQALDSVIAGAATANGAIVADGFAAFQGPSLAAGGDPCAAGLLIRLPDGTCNIHPSRAGHRLLAQAILKALGA